MSIQVKLSPRPRKHKVKEVHQEMKQEIVAQVHKQTLIVNGSDDYTNEDEKHGSQQKSDKNENYSTSNMVLTPSREISVDGESQINSKILSLIETEMKKDINKHSHFTESRPQSLSFYEDEKLPEELSGNLELLSPEEKRHIKKRREYLQMDTDDRNAYNVIQDLYNSKDNDDIITGNKKRKKKKYGESETGIGDSREMMIPKEKKKTKRKKRDGSPAMSSSSKRKHKTKRDDNNQLKTDITLALEDLQDDVFDNTPDDLTVSRTEKMRRSPRRSDKIYVQKKTKFEATTRHHNGNNPLNRQAAQDFDENLGEKRFSYSYPLESAITLQKFWSRFSNLIHGLLGGLALGHWLYIMSNLKSQDQSFLLHYAYFSDIYVGLFFALCVLCLLSVFDRLDIGHIQWSEIGDFVCQRKRSVVVLIYAACFIVHLSASPYDDALSLVTYNDNKRSTNRSTSDIHQEAENSTFYPESESANPSTNSITSSLTPSELRVWNNLSTARSILAVLGWLIIGLGPSEDLLYGHLQNLEQYLPHTMATY